jgi:hypothetical protein
MSTQTDAPNLAIVATGTVGRHTLVTAAGVVQNGASVTRTHVGIAQQDYVTGDVMQVRMPHAGSAKVVASVAIAVGALLYYAANGKVGTTATSNTAVGIALTAASGDGSIIEMLPL